MFQRLYLFPIVLTLCFQPATTNSAQEDVGKFNQDFLHAVQVSRTIIKTPIVIRELEFDKATIGNIHKIFENYEKQGRLAVHPETFGRVAALYELPTDVFDRDELVDRLIHKRFKDLQSQLSQSQSSRLDQILVQTAAWSQEPLGMYEHRLIKSELELTNSQVELLRESVLRNRREYYSTLVELHDKYHKRIREALPVRDAEKLQEVLGESVIVPRIYFVNKKRIASTAGSQEFKSPFARGFSDHTGVRISDILADPWLSQQLDLTDEQLKQITELNQKTREVLQENGPEKFVKIENDKINEELGLDDSHLEAIKRANEPYKAKLDEIYEAYYTELGEFLLPSQLDRIKQIALQLALNKPPPFGIYLNKDFARIAGLSTRQRGLLKRAIGEELESFLEAERKIMRQYHDKVRGAAGEEVARKLDELLGEPFEYLRPNPL